MPSIFTSSLVFSGVLGLAFAVAKQAGAERTHPSAPVLYTCQSQVEAFGDRSNVSLTEALQLVQQLEGNQFTYHCSPTPMAVSGVITYRQRMALPPGAVIEVKLADVSRVDAAATTIAEQTITTTGQQVSIPFSLPYDSSQIDPHHQYAVQVRVLVDGKLRWISTSRYSVITQDYPSQVEILVEPVSS